MKVIELRACNIHTLLATYIVGENVDSPTSLLPMMYGCYTRTQQVDKATTLPGKVTICKDYSDLTSHIRLDGWKHWSKDHES